MLAALEKFWREFVAFIGRTIGRSRSEETTRQGLRIHPQAYRLLKFESRTEALNAIRTAGVVALVGSVEKFKWAYLTCPCGCGEALNLNLMKTHSPHWRLEEISENNFSLNPSVDSTNCGAHFWLRDGRVIWCD